MISHECTKTRRKDKNNMIKLIKKQNQQNIESLGRCGRTI